MRLCNTYFLFYKYQPLSNTLKLRTLLRMTRILLRMTRTLLRMTRTLLRMTCPPYFASFLLVRFYYKLLKKLSIYITFTTNAICSLF